MTTTTRFPDDAERDVRKHLKARLKVLGGELRKVSWVLRRGAPDELVFIPARFSYPAHVVWVELKRPGKRPEPHQQREIDKLLMHGADVQVLDCREAVDALLFWGRV